jgi:hypothetical protein
MYTPQVSPCMRHFCCPPRPTSSGWLCRSCDSAAAVRLRSCSRTCILLLLAPEPLKDHSRSLCCLVCSSPAVSGQSAPWSLWMLLLRLLSCCSIWSQASMTQTCSPCCLLLCRTRTFSVITALFSTSIADQSQCLHALACMRGFYRRLPCMGMYLPRSTHRSQWVSALS